MFIKALLIAIYAGIAGIEQFDGLQSLHRPIIAGLVIGLILGDLQKGLIVGGSVELIFMGLVPLAGAQPPNIVVGGVMGISLALLTGIDAKEAIAVVVPLALIGQIIVTLMFALYSGMMSYGDKCADDANTGGINFIILLQLMIRFVLFGGVSFLFVYYGAEPVKNLISALPEWLVHGFGVAGGMMPAIGFALLLNIMLKKEYFGFLIVGYILAAYLKLDLVAITLAGLSIALYDYYSNTGKVVATRGDEEDGI
ncbi:PTS mannose/fructose/sorbose/N-acetylgalactosamine transporter subunit IIC [Oceanivirga salmonicida]|uniref:PTS mannose/fructose/sorbose/N-acetylgalactosamine transporter subunit IIC n=1 Tax=Oceanivirga salmonicida TaxID=1769291 RepID=UPI000836C364|nr:PTS sugar transporter subunit IIC [Oceanivirga salmonicida]